MVEDSVPTEPPYLQPIPIDDLVPAAYDDLKRMARSYLRAQKPPATLCTTELVHEAFVKLAGPAGSTWQGKAHFFGAAARAMRQVLVDFARRRGAMKRGGEARRITLADDVAALNIQLDEILSLDEALEQLDSVDARLRQIVELRFFAGLPASDIAIMLGVSERTIDRDWLKARLFLLAALNKNE